MGKVSKIKFFPRFEPSVLFGSVPNQIVRALEGDVSLEDLNVKPEQASSYIFGSGSDTYEASSSYSASMKKYIRKKAMDNNHDYTCSEYGATSKYGLDSSSSSGSSPEILSRKGSHAFQS
ncbi:hypothetical protein TorRG33x02_192890 [Trema orientale]|uniref:Uncharacterized protein n=1 Tax=Trema orientale TaxID=63057 RepID=A0A2P5EH84_TREOI|nr:hypothetical protein TorRG33x02_192890 [Trema orientale]